MKKKIFSKIEIEFRSILKKGQYQRMQEFLSKKATGLGEDDKDVYFFIMPDKLLKIVNNISRNNAALVIKLNKIGRGSDFEEIELPITQKDVKKAVKFFTALGITDNIMHSFQKRHNYLYKGVEIALKYSNIWGYHLEFEIVVDNKNKKMEAEIKIKNLANELGVKLMNDVELSKFTKKAEEKYKKQKRLK